MGLPNGVTKTRSGLGDGRPVPRSVVPAIPLPYIQRRTNSTVTQQATITALRHAANGSAPKVQDELAAEPASNQGGEEQAGDALHTLIAPNPIPNGELPPGSITAESSPSPAPPTASVPPAVGAPDIPAFSNPATTSKVDIPQPPHSIQASDKDAQTVSPATVRPPVVVSPLRASMPPSFQPSNRLQHLNTNGDGPRIPRPIPNGPPHMHHPHPSNGSLQFGGFSSNNSSPAPPHSGGFVPPPPGVPIMDGRRPFHAHAPSSNGFPPPMPYGTEFVPVSGLDGYGRPVPAPVMMDSYPPYGNAYGPSTPHSFQESHSSAPADDVTAYGQFPPPPPPGMHNGGPLSDEPRSQNRPGRAINAFPLHHHGMMPGPVPPPHVLHHQPPDAHETDGLVAYTRAQFQDTTFADCTLELRYLDDRAPPVRLPGHRFVLARSQPIRAILESGSPVSSPPGMATRTVLLQSDDKYLRSDAFWTAVQRLYAFPLFDIPQRPGSVEEGLTLAGSGADQFDFALGYAAAGHLLGWPSIVARGINIAANLLSWSTLEKALDFALGGLSDRASADRHTHFTYGEPVQALLNGISNFIITNFPPNFFLDASTADTTAYARIPEVPAPPVQKPNTPTIARGTSVHVGPGRRPQLSHIKFGDISPSSAAPEGTQQSGAMHPDGLALTPQQRQIHLTLSRVLLNLPFAYLKPALESGGYGNVSGWANAEARHQVIRDVVMERENRRQRALAAVQAGVVPNADSIWASLRGVEPQYGSQWHVLGWREEVVPYGNGDVPTLIRKWAPLLKQGGGEPNPGPETLYP